MLMSNRSKRLNLANWLVWGGWMAVCSAQTLPDEVETEDYSAKYQVTYNLQRHGPFSSPYSAVNSLTAAEDRMFTLSATAHWGFRPWQDGEIYFNPEVVEGVPFTGSLIGMAGYTNGEITRAAGVSPQYYRQRLFLRQTWNNGGGREVVESDFNQMAGMVDKNRWVLTVGNFSILDVFDDNAYAKDPRTQFMNWGNWTYAAYDYAADARGFGWGATLEWYFDNWALRAGRMTAPIAPNLLPVDMALGRHYGDQVEVERAHTLLGQPGKVRLLAWRDHAVMASFSDATQWLEQQRALNPSYQPTGPDALLAVRDGVKTKFGLGLNVEQAINSDVGYFLRLMRTDGRTETLAFTEADGSLSTGLVFKGGLWQRPDDAVGVAWMRTTLSSDRQNFLKNGGISFFIGDGSLNYAPEQVLECFYSLQMTKGLWLTADYQRMRNPAYNADRGPVNVYAARVHAEF